MATSKIKAIKGTLKKAIDYISNPEKTDGGLLISSFGCSAKTADIEMKITADKGRKSGNRIAYHLMQSFSPEDDITSEEAHRLGKEFADKILGGRYEYIICTHIDKEHIHNHIIFNATNFVDHKKYHHKIQDTKRIRDINDRICKENGLSVIEKTSGIRGKSKYEYEQSKAGTSWKDKLKEIIDEAISQAGSFHEFLEILELEGCEVKQGKHIAFRLIDQERFTRGKRIGELYQEDAIRDRIENKTQYVSKDNPSEKAVKNKSSKQPNVKNNRINLIVDISKNVKAQQSKGYEHALVRSNLDNLVKTMNYLIRHKLSTPEEFQKHAGNITADYNFCRSDIKKIEDKMIRLSEKIKFTQNYKKHKSIYTASLKEKPGSDFFRTYEEQIILYQASLIYFERNQIDPDSLNLTKLFEDYKDLKQMKESARVSYKSVEGKLKELSIIQKNVESSLGLKIEEDTSDNQEKKNKKSEERNL